MANVNVRPSEANKSSWQLFGTNFDHPVTIEEAIESAGLNYTVESQPLIRVPKEIADAILRGESVHLHVRTSSRLISPLSERITIQPLVSLDVTMVSLITQRHSNSLTLLRR